MVECFDCLRHDAVICCNYEHCNISDLGTTCTHSGKGFVTWCIDKCNRAINAIVIMVNLVGTDVLGDAAGFALNHFCLTNRIKKRSLTVIHVSHNGDNWWSGGEIFFIVIAHFGSEIDIKSLQELTIFFLRRNNFDDISKLCTKNFEGISINRLSCSHHFTKVE